MHSDLESPFTPSAFQSPHRPCYSIKGPGSSKEDESSFIFSGQDRHSSTGRLDLFHEPETKKAHFRSLSDRPDWMRAASYVCTEVPEPTWKSLLWQEDRLTSKQNQTSELPKTYPSFHKPQECEPPSLARISEASTDHSSDRPSLLASLGKVSASKYVDLEPDAFNRWQTSAGFNDYCLDDPLGISIIRPDPFSETRERLKHINNEVKLLLCAGSIQ